MRFLREAAKRPFRISVGQWAGTTIRSPWRKRSRSPSVQLLASSSKHQAKAAEASTMKTAISTCGLRGWGPWFEDLRACCPCANREFGRWLRELIEDAARLWSQVPVAAEARGHGVSVEGSVRE